MDEGVRAADGKRAGGRARRQRTVFEVGASVGVGRCGRLRATVGVGAAGRRLQDLYEEHGAAREYALQGGGRKPATMAVAAPWRVAPSSGVWW